MPSLDLIKYPSKTAVFCGVGLESTKTCPLFFMYQAIFKHYDSTTNIWVVSRSFCSFLLRECKELKGEAERLAKEDAVSRAKRRHQL